MTAVLAAMRRLDAAHARGDINAVELAEAKAKLMDAIPDITPDEPSEPHRETRANASSAAGAGSGLGQIMLFCAVILVASAGLALLLTGDLMLSATLAITVLAAFSVMLFRQLDS
ncbi:MAG: hypothetical protein AAGL96_07075 [Pseudomonadota bacterium]|mgnify:CR=1 FL=1